MGPPLLGGGGVGWQSRGVDGEREDTVASVGARVVVWRASRKCYAPVVEATSRSGLSPDPVAGGEPRWWGSGVPGTSASSGGMRHEASWVPCKCPFPLRGHRDACGFGLKETLDG